MDNLSVDKREYLSDIIAASLLENLDGEGEQELIKWLDENSSNRDFYESLKESFSSGKMLSELSGYNSVGDWVLVKQKATRFRRRTLHRRSALYAAAITGILVVFSIFFMPLSDKKSSDTELLSNAADTVLKQNYKAILMLPSGDVVNLGEEVELKDYNIKNNGTTLEYKSEAQAKLDKGQPKIHTLRVPRGSEYKVVLSDGSTVHLNADSELRYPERFDGDSRMVELSGQAWFDVVHEPQTPFVVKSGDMSVEVLGTEFDFRCYEGEPRAATLADGRLRVTKGEDVFEIEPGVQVYERDNTLQMRRVDVAQYTAWLNRRFTYKGASLEYVMNDIARWYDMQIEFRDGSTSKTRLTANIPRYENLEGVLNIIRDVVYADIKVDGGTITVSGENI